MKDEDQNLEKFEEIEDSHTTEGGWGESTGSGGWDQFLLLLNDKVRVKSISSESENTDFTVFPKEPKVV